MVIPPDLERQILATPGVVVRRPANLDDETSVSDEPPRKTEPLMVLPVVTLCKGVLTMTLPIITVSEINGRDWRARSKRTQAARKVVSKFIGRNMELFAPFAKGYHSGAPLLVSFVRLGGHRMDRSNLPTALKGTEDAICLMGGFDDGSPLWKATWDQKNNGPIGVMVSIMQDQGESTCLC